LADFCVPEPVAEFDIPSFIGENVCIIPPEDILDRPSVDYLLPGRRAAAVFYRIPFEYLLYRTGAET